MNLVTGFAVTAVASWKNIAHHTMTRTRTPMTNRRRHPRHVVPQPADAVLDVFRAASVTRVGPTEFSCVGLGRYSAGDELKLNLVGVDSRATVQACVVGTRPVPLEGALHQEIRLRARGSVTIQRFGAAEADSGDDL
jgi:hypothetical protein